jgi:hypothetical protein
MTGLEPLRAIAAGELAGAPIAKPMCLTFPLDGAAA